jgi:hypothetical protein
MPFANANIWLLPFLFIIPFYFFFLSYSSGQEFRNYVNKIGASEHPCLVSNFRGYGFSFYPCSMILALDFTYSLYYVEVHSYIPRFIRTFIKKWCWKNWCWILSKAFSISVEMIVWFLSLLLFIYCIYWFTYVYHPCIPGKKSTWSWYMIFLIWCCI